MKTRTIAALALISLSLTTAARAVDLIAIGKISGIYEDFSTDTAFPLENGVAGNLFGGLGSGFAYAGGTTFLGLPDRGPNANAYNPAVDDTVSFIARFQEMNMSLAPTEDPLTGLPFTLTPMLRGTTLLSSATRLVYGDGSGAGLDSGAPVLNTIDHTNYFTGRSDNLDPSKPSTNP